MKLYYVEWLKEDRPVIDIPIDDIYCKHEKDYSKYRNNYRNQLLDLINNPQERFIIEKERNLRLSRILKEKGSLYPIAVYEYISYQRTDATVNPYMCVDGHHRIMAYLKSGYNTIPAIIYKNLDEALKAKLNAPYTDYYEDLMTVNKLIGA